MSDVAEVSAAPGPQPAAERLRAHGLRVTAQRRAILAAFDEAGAGHLSAEAIHERLSQTLPELARATVYNTLNDFVASGLLRRIDGLGPALYDSDCDERHHHFHCLECGELFDVEPTGEPQLSNSGFQVERTEILFRGRCATCASRG